MLDHLSCFNFALYERKIEIQINGKYHAAVRPELAEGQAKRR
jgi:hypothetical protein